MHRGKHQGLFESLTKLHGVYDLEPLVLELAFQDNPLLSEIRFLLDQLVFLRS